jgi:hypothetical protein
LNKIVTFLLLVQKKSNQKKKTPRTLRSNQEGRLTTLQPNTHLAAALRRAHQKRKTSQSQFLTKRTPQLGHLFMQALPG